MKRRILFITTHNLATNPRLVKEMRLAIENGFSVEVICFEFDNWSKSINDSLMRSFGEVTFHIIPAGRKPLLPWLRSAISELLIRKMSSVLKLSVALKAQSVSRRNMLIMKALNNVSHPDWVIGHNPGALYATYMASQRFQCQSGFDVEDYHPGETNPIVVQEHTRQLMQRLLPAFDYVSFASDLIQKQCIVADGIRPIKHSILLHNAFSTSEFNDTPFACDGKMKMVWFSQHISFNRGIEHFIRIAEAQRSIMELHLYGHLDAEFEKQYLQDKRGVVLHGVVSQQQLHQELSSYDVGLALEPGKDLNNELAVSNKIMAYLQSGLLVLATDTIAQQNMINDFPSCGMLINKDCSNAQSRLMELADNINIIRSERKKRFELMKPFAWETASIPLLEMWNKKNSHSSTR